MLTYFQNSDSKNAVDDATKMIDRYVRKVKSLPEVEAGYIIDNKEKVAAKIREKYPDYAENVDELVEKCQSAGITKIVGYYYPTAKNGMVKDFYALQGFVKVAEDENGNTVWEYVVTSQYEKKNKVIEVNGKSTT